MTQAAACMQTRHDGICALRAWHSWLTSPDVRAGFEPY